MKYEDWYNKVDVLFEIQKQCKNKESAFLGDKRVRNITFKNTYQIKSNLKVYQYGKKKGRFNLYKSFANVNNFPLCSYNHLTRKKQSDEINLIFEKYITGYDVGFDFDAHEGQYTQAYVDCKVLKNYFDTYKVAYSLVWSGSGFHLYVEHNNLPTNIKNETDIYKKLKLIHEMIVDIDFVMGLETLDTGRDTEGVANGSFYTLRRIWKVAYSWDVKTNRIALPLTDVMFNNFDLKYVDPEWVDKHVVIRNRGLLTRRGDSEGFNKLLNKLKGD